MSVLSGKRLTGKLIYGLELLALMALVVLEYLSGYKGGLMKHLYFRKMEYMFTVYTKTGIALHTVILLVLLLSTAFRVFRRRQGSFSWRCLYRIGLYSTALLCAFCFPPVQALNIYPYLLMFLELLVLVEVGKILLNRPAMQQACLQPLKAKA